MLSTSGLFAVIVTLAVGREGVLAAAGREARCGRRLVSGLFARPRLPLGYSLVTTVPRGACRLNVSELLPSDNYIALKMSNSSYIINGEFAVSTPGIYDAAGTRFIYKRVAELDSVTARGPILHPIDIMILYTQANPSIKYEYLTESLPDELDIVSTGRDSFALEFSSTTSPKHTRRHHAFRPRIPNDNSRYPNFSASNEEEGDDEDTEDNNYLGSRTFKWKILSYSPCSRTCGGGVHTVTYGCVEVSSTGSDREAYPSNCTVPPPANRRKRCGTGPCPPRWRAAAWSLCPKCGPATRTRIVGCVQDHMKGIIKISDHKCPAPKPDIIEKCKIPDCNLDDFTERSQETGQDLKGFMRPRVEIDSFRNGPIYTFSVNNTEEEIGPEYAYSAAGGWLYTEWSKCVGWCVGSGIQTRSVRCADPAGCAPRRAPEVTKVCSPGLSCEPYEGQWFTGSWSACSSPCGGKQIRGVLCIGGTGRHLKDSACKEPRPDHEQDCESKCTPSWYTSDWSQCRGNCNEGIQRRTVWCARSDEGIPVESECKGPKPPAQQKCQPERCLATHRATVPPELTIESQRVTRNEMIDDEDHAILTKDNAVQTEVTTPKVNKIETKDCEDKLGTCALAVQARLCHYKYYTQNCCSSCRGR